MRGAINELKGDPYATALYDHLAALVEAGWGNAQQLLQIEADFANVKPTFAMEALRKRVDEFAFLINQREQQALNMVLDTALSEGWTSKQLAGEISQTLSDGYHVIDHDENGQLVVKRTIPTDAWASTVARTELNRAQTMGALELFRSADIEKVQWVTNGGSTVCDDCDALDGQIFAIDEVPDCPYHPNCCCGLSAADEDVKFSDEEADASAEVVDAANDENAAALERYNISHNHLE